MTQERVRFVESSRVPHNTVCELEFIAHRDFEDPWSEIEVDFSFVDPDGAQRVVPAYWAGGRSWRVRYSSSTEGAHRFTSSVRGGADVGLEDITGELTVVGYQGVNPLLLHGGPRVASDGMHLSYGDGTPFLWLGDTWWSAMTARFRWPSTFQTIADDRAAKGFTVVQMVAGLIPEFVPFSPSMASEGGQPWQRQGTGPINPDYYAVPDLKVDYLVSKGIVPCIVGGWGYFAEILGRERVMQHWRYLVAKYSAYPVIWCIAGEVDLPAQHDAPLGDRAPPSEQVAIWEDASRLVARIDPFHRVRTVHPCPAFTYASSEVFSSPELYDLDMLQTGHAGRNSIPRTMHHLRTAVERAAAPVVNGECNYEGIFDSNWQDMQRFLFWTHMLSGTAGHTYGTMAISTFNSKDDPSEPLSRVSIHYWEDAINWLGAAHVAVGKRMLEQFPWWQLRPAPDDVEPHAGPDDWFLPYAARLPNGTVIIYFPGLCMQSGSAARAGAHDQGSEMQDWTRLTRVVLNNLAERPHRGTFVNPRTGKPYSSFAINPLEGHHALQSERWVTPTGEDWVLVVEQS